MFGLQSMNAYTQFGYVPRILTDAGIAPAAAGGLMAQIAGWGVLGARIDLIEHQLRVAEVAAERRPPRLLLADEVGLGKTIEACLIAAQQLACGRAQRVLVLVPEVEVRVGMGGRGLVSPFFLCFLLGVSFP